MAKAVVNIDGYKILISEASGLEFIKENESIIINKVTLDDSTLFQEKKQATKIKNMWLLINKEDQVEVLPIINGQPLRNQVEVVT